MKRDTVSSMLIRLAFVSETGKLRMKKIFRMILLEAHRSGQPRGRTALGFSFRAGRGFNLLCREQKGAETNVKAE